MKKKILIIGKHSYIASNFKSYLADVHPDWNVDLCGASDGEWETISFSEYNCILFLAAIVHKKEKGINYDIYRNLFF